MGPLNFILNTEHPHFSFSRYEKSTSVSSLAIKANRCPWCTVPHVRALQALSFQGFTFQTAACTIFMLWPCTSKPPACSTGKRSCSVFMWNHFAWWNGFAVCPFQCLLCSAARNTNAEVQVRHSSECHVGKRHCHCCFFPHRVGSQVPLGVWWKLEALS